MNARWNSILGYWLCSECGEPYTVQGEAEACYLPCTTTSTVPAKSPETKPAESSLPTGFVILTSLIGAGLAVTGYALRIPAVSLSGTFLIFIAGYVTGWLDHKSKEI